MAEILPTRRKTLYNQSINQIFERTFKKTMCELNSAIVEVHVFISSPLFLYAVDVFISLANIDFI